MKALVPCNLTLSLPIALLMVLSHGCRDEPPAGPHSVPGPEMGDYISDDQLGESRHMIALAREVPGFAGIYYEPGDDRLIIAMTAESIDAFPKATKAVSAMLAGQIDFAPMGDVPPLEFVARVVKYSFLDLARHRARLRPHLYALPGVSALSVDEANNKIAVALQDMSAIVGVEELATTLQIPSDMISFSRESPSVGRGMRIRQPNLPIRQLSAGSDGRMRGGDFARREGRQGGCSVSFTALTLYGGAPVFVVPSHCTQRFYDFDGGTWIYNGSRIGAEISDPGGRTIENCVRRRPLVWDKEVLCRESDAALIGVDSYDDIALGELRGGRVIHGAGSNIAGESVYLLAHSPTHAIDARVDGTCVDAFVAQRDDGNWYGVSCPDKIITSEGIGVGQSGAVIYKTVGSYVVLTGVQFAAGIASWLETSTTNWVSPVGSIERELGALWVSPDFGDPSVYIGSGPTVVQEEAECVWTASGRGMGVSYSWSGVLGGTSSQASGTVMDSGWLRVTVTDIRARTASDSIYITVVSEDDDAECGV